MRPDMERWFMFDESRISRYLKEALEHVFKQLAFTLSFDKQRLNRDIPYMAYQMGKAIGVPRPSKFRVWGLVDGVFRRIARPSRGYVRYHATSV